MKKIIIVVSILLVSVAVFGQERSYNLYVEVKSNIGAHEYRDTLIDELFYEFGLHSEIEYLSVRSWGSGGGPYESKGEPDSDLPVIGAMFTLVDVQGGVVVFVYIYGELRDRDPASGFVAHTTERSTWARSPYDDIGRDVARTLVRDLTTFGYISDVLEYFYPDD